MRRNNADGILEMVERRGRIRSETLQKLLVLLATKTDYPFHVEVAVVTGGLLKTIDNEEDALETIRRLEAAPAKKPGKSKERA